jgi:hypothetical protein
MKYTYYLEFPHLVKFHYSVFQNFRTQIYTGGNLSFAVYGVIKTIKSTNPHNSFSYKYSFFSLGAGDLATPVFTDYSFILGESFTYKKFLLDIRYTRGLKEIYPRIYLKTISISLGYMLN